MADERPEIVSLRKSVLREVSQFLPGPLRALRPHEATDLDCRIDDAIADAIDKAAIKKAKSILEDELEVVLSNTDKAFAEVEAAESSLEDAEFAHEESLDDVRRVERSIRKVEKMAGKR